MRNISGDSLKKATNKDKNVQFYQAMAGLPINYNLIKDFEHVNPKGFSLSSGDRKASPIFISLHKKNDKLFTRIAILKSAFAEEKIQFIQGKTNEIFSDVENVYNFDTLKNKINEVIFQGK